MSSMSTKQELVTTISGRWRLSIEEEEEINRLTLNQIREKYKHTASHFEAEAKRFTRLARIIRTGK